MLAVEQAPISCAQLFPTRKAAQQSGRCRLEIVICRGCAHIWNAAYQPPPASLYNDDYYSSVTVSSQAREYQVNLANQLDRLVGLRGKNALEIGCGDGFFLQVLSSLGAGAIGFEPSSTFNLVAKLPGIQVFNEYFSFNHGQDLRPDPDVVVMRHVLEHMASPKQQLQSLAANYSAESRARHLFLEVPNANQILKDRLFFDFYHDHVQYFSLGSLHRVLTEAGWTPVAKLGSDDEFLQVLSENAGFLQDQSLLLGQDQISSANQEVLSAAGRFRQEYRRWQARLTEMVADLRGRGMTIAAWGAGARGVALLSGLHLPDGALEYVVDSDPNKGGRFLPSVHIPVFPPEQLEQQPVDCVMVTSYTFFDEILAGLDRFRNEGGKVLKVYPSPALV